MGWAAAPLVLALTVAPAAGQTASAGLNELAFMAGCWEGEFRARSGAAGVIEEHYTSPSDNVMLGTTRYLLEGRSVQFELTAIRDTEAGVVLRPYPGGTASPATFALTAASGEEAVFEAPEHDFPKRIIYTLTGEGQIQARVDDGTDDGQAMEWQLARAACPGG